MRSTIKDNKNHFNFALLNTIYLIPIENNIY